MTDEPRPQERPRRARERHERVRRDVQGEREAVPRRVDEPARRGPRAWRTRARGRGCRSTSCVSPQRAKTRSMSLVGLDVARLDERRPDRLGKRPDALLDQALDGREADLGALRVERPGDAPGDRVIVRDAEDQRRSCPRAGPSVTSRVPMQPTIMPDRKRPPTALRDALRGVAGFVLDADGVLFLKGEPIAGSMAALAAALARAGIPYRVVTNFSPTAPRHARARFTGDGSADRSGADHHGHFGRCRLHRATPTPAGRSSWPRPTRCASSTASGSCRSRRGGRAPEGTVAAVVIGDAGDELSYRTSTSCSGSSAAARRSSRCTATRGG